MSVPCKFERSLLSHEEYETIRLTHHPAIYDVEAGELEAMRPRLRTMHDKERTLSRQKRREGRGKAEARGASFPGTVEHASQRKQVFAAALKRVNKELSRPSQPGSSDRTCRSGSKGSRATSSSELHDLSPRRSYRERRHGAEGEHTPKKDHYRRKNRTSVAGDESRSGGARCARCMSLGRQRLCDRAPTPCRRERDFCCWRH